MLLNSGKKIKQDMFVLHIGFNGTTRVLPRPKSFESYKKNLETAKRLMEDIRKYSTETYIDSRIRDILNEIFAELLLQSLYFEEHTAASIRLQGGIEPVKIGELSLFVATTKRGRLPWEFSSNFKAVSEIDDEMKKGFEEELRDIHLSLKSNDLDENAKRMSFLMNLEPEILSKGLKAFSNQFSPSGNSWSHDSESKFPEVIKPLLFLCDRKADGVFEQEKRITFSQRPNHEVLNDSLENAALLMKKQLKLISFSSTSHMNLALMEDRQGRQQLFSWGTLPGTLSKINYPKPFDMTFLNGAKITQLASGSCHTIAQAQTTDGQDLIFSWGTNSYGQLGLGHDNFTITPQPLDMDFLNGAKIKQLIPGPFYTIIHAQAADGQDLLFSCGDNRCGELGLGHDVQAHTPTPLDMTFLNGAEIKQLVLGDYHALIQARTADGQDLLFSWGDNECGQLGLGHNNLAHTPQPLDMTFLNGAEIKQLFLGYEHTMIHAQTGDGQDLLFGWGHNEYGQLGLGHNTNENTPQPLDMTFLNGAKIIQLVMSAENHTIIHTRTADGQDVLFSWGDTEYGQLGLADKDLANTPQPFDMTFLNGAEIRQLFMGGNHTLIHAQTTNGQDLLFGLGENDRGQLGLGHNKNENIPQPLDMTFLNGAKVKQLFLDYWLTIIEAQTTDSQDLLFSCGGTFWGQSGLGHDRCVNTPQPIAFNWVDMTQKLATEPSKPMIHGFKTHKQQTKEEELKTTTQPAGFQEENTIRQKLNF